MLESATAKFTAPPWNTTLHLKRYYSVFWQNLPLQISTVNAAFLNVTRMRGGRAVLAKEAVIAASSLLSNQHRDTAKAKLNPERDLLFHPHLRRFTHRLLELPQPLRGPLLLGGVRVVVERRHRHVDHLEARFLLHGRAGDSRRTLQRAAARLAHNKRRKRRTALLSSAAHTQMSNKTRNATVKNAQHVKQQRTATIFVSSRQHNRSQRKKIPS